MAPKKVSRPMVFKMASSGGFQNESSCGAPAILVQVNIGKSNNAVNLGFQGYIQAPFRPDNDFYVLGRKHYLINSLLSGTQKLGLRLPLTGAEIPKIGKRGCRSQKPPFPTTPEKGGRKWGCLDSETLFLRFWGISAPVRGKHNPNPKGYQIQNGKFRGFQNENKCCAPAILVRVQIRKIAWNPFNENLP